MVLAMSADDNPCAHDPNGAGCINGHIIRDDIDETRKDQRNADEKAVRDAVDAICAAARDQGDENACAN